MEHSLIRRGIPYFIHNLEETITAFGNLPSALYNPALFLAVSMHVSSSPPVLLGGVRYV